MTCRSVADPNPILEVARVVVITGSLWGSYCMLRSKRLPIQGLARPVCRIPRTCRSKRAAGNWGRWPWAKSWSRRMCRIPRTCQPKRAVGGLEELDLGEELEQANVQNPSHLSAETSCRVAGRAGSGRRAGAGECAGSLAPVSRNELSGLSGRHWAQINSRLQLTSKPIP